MQDRAAEQSLLGSLILDDRALGQVREMLDADDFGDARHGAIWRAACSLADRGEAIDVVTLRCELERAGQLGGGIDYLAELATVTPAATSVRHYARIVVDLATRRRLEQAGMDIAGLARDADAVTADLVAGAEARILGVVRERNHREAVSIADGLSETWSSLERSLGRRQFVTGVPTGFTDLDRSTQGWQPGELVIIAARPSVGKTAFALNSARCAAKTHPTVVFSLEMSRDALLQRMLCSEACVDSFLLKTGGADASVFQRIARAMDRLRALSLLIDDTAALSLALLRHRARRMVSEGRCALLVVDYLQLMHANRREGRVQEVSDISAGLKAIAREFNIPVIAISQLSRESEKRHDRRPQLSDLRDSGTIEQDADVVLMLYREGMHNQEVDKTLTKLIVAKNRNGPVGEIDLYFIAEQTAFREPHRAREEPVSQPAPPPMPWTPALVEG